MAFFTRNQKDDAESADQPAGGQRSEAQQGISRRKTGAGTRDAAAADELRRRARRRLVGAIAMVLAAVIVLPMVLDSEPEPLPENIPIQIPGQSAAFQPNLSAPDPAETPSPSAAPTPPSGGEAPVGVPAPVAVTPGAPVDPRTPASLAQVTPVESATTPPPEPEPKPQPKPAPAAKPETARTPPPAPVARTPAPNPAAAQKEAEAARALALLQGKPVPARSSSSADAAPSRYAVQVVAVRSREGADALMSKLKGAGLSAYIETIKTPDGQVHRVRLGPFNSRSQAESAQAKLRGLPGGYNGSLVPL